MFALSHHRKERDDFTAVSSALRQYLPERDTPYILDVDLDFFSTKNPFKNLHDRVNLYEKLAPLYAFHRPDSTDPENRLSSPWPGFSRISMRIPGPTATQFAQSIRAASHESPCDRSSNSHVSYVASSSKEEDPPNRGIPRRGQRTKCRSTPLC
ncbi:unnamed protein product [Xylocopa violacea]|uniref:Uncharacterized protein n=1 Tax=Xylocopa violacea TaxID=135666 RepID=A0ABP1N463_XYLVO